MKTVKIQDKDFIWEKSEEKDYEDWVFLNGIDALVQRINNRLKLFKNEWFLDTNEGIDWISVFEKPFSTRKMESEIFNTIIKDEAVDSIEKIDIEPNFQQRSIKIDISATAGSEIINISQELTD